MVLAACRLPRGLAGRRGLRRQCLLLVLVVAALIVAILRPAHLRAGRWHWAPAAAQRRRQGRQLVARLVRVGVGVRVGVRVRVRVRVRVS